MPLRYGVGERARALELLERSRGTLRLRRLNPTGDYTNRTSKIFNLAGTPLAMAAGAMTTPGFTIPADATVGHGTCIVEVVAATGLIGGYSVQMTAP